MLAGAVVGAALAAYVVKVRRDRAQREDRSAEPLLQASAGSKVSPATADSAYGTMQPECDMSVGCL